MGYVKEGNGYGERCPPTPSTLDHYSANTPIGKRQYLDHELSRREPNAQRLAWVVVSFIRLRVTTAYVCGTAPHLPPTSTSSKILPPATNSTNHHYIGCGRPCVLLQDADSVGVPVHLTNRPPNKGHTSEPCYQILDLKKVCSKLTPKRPRAIFVSCRGPAG